jgi:prepilin-type N-terminal cleavage/methylation domain-containing protein
MRRSNGFTLVEIVVVLLIFAVIVSMGAVITRAVMAGQKRSVTTTRLTAIDAALAQYAAVQKRLPCPADGRKNSSNAADAGIQFVATTASAGCLLTEQRYGVVPWRDLGLSEEDATDGWGRRFTYRVFPILSADSGMDMSQCDAAGGNGGALTGTCGAAGTPCCATCVSTSLAACNTPLIFLKPSRSGLAVQNMSGTAVMDPTFNPPTGAAYVVISHGETGGGGYLSTGQLFISATNGKDSDQEKSNYADAAPPPPAFIDDGINDNVDATPSVHFDDIVSRPSVVTVINKAGLGPRAH